MQRQTINFEENLWLRTYRLRKNRYGTFTFAFNRSKMIEFDRLESDSNEKFI